MESFWQELKRRKTGKVIVAYAATAFILLQLADILTPALLLPEWTTRLITLILIIGFPIAVIFSWVFDITPQGIIKTESATVSEKKRKIATPSRKVFTISNFVIAVLFVVVAVLAYPKIFKKDTLERLRSSGERISIAVMPFQNITKDTALDVWQDGIQVNLIASLTNVEALRVRQIESISSIIRSKGLADYASITPSFASAISQKLDASVLIIGGISKSGSTIRLNAQLVDSKTQDILKSFQKDGTAGNILDIIDSLSLMVKNFLILSILKKEVPADIQKFGSTISPLAYRYFILGQNAFSKRDMSTAIEMYSQAIKIDSNFYFGALEISQSYLNLGLSDSAKKYCLKVYKKIDQMSLLDRVWTNMKHAKCFETPYEEIKYANQFLEIDDQQPIIYYIKGCAYMDLFQFDKAIPEFEKSLEIYNKWGSKPMWAPNYTALGNAYHKTGQYKKEKELYKSAELDFPDNYVLNYQKGLFAITEGDTVIANRYFGEAIRLAKEYSWTDANIASQMAFGMSDIGKKEKAEEYYREALSLEPGKPERMNDLAFLLIDSERNIAEGMDLAARALEIRPDYYLFLHTKGWGLFKQAKYREALDILQKSWDLRREKAVYDHAAYLHLEAAKKAVAGQKN